MNRIIKIFILYCFPILTIQSCGKQCHPQPFSDPETNSNNQNLSQTQQPISGITDAMCKKTKDYLLGLRASPITFFEQTIQEIRNGTPAAVNKQNPNPGYNNFTVLHYAIYSDNEELFEELLKLSPDLKQKDGSAMTILLVAIDRRKVNFVNMILARPKLETFINEPNSYGTKPLAYAKNMKNWPGNLQQKNDTKAIIQALQANGAV
jgi:ankyrin repeat protein